MMTNGEFAKAIDRAVNDKEAWRKSLRYFSQFTNYSLSASYLAKVAIGVCDKDDLLDLIVEKGNPHLHKDWVNQCREDVYERIPHSEHLAKGVR